MSKEEQKKEVFRILELKENENIKNLLTYPAKNYSSKFTLLDIMLDNLLGTYKNMNSLDKEKYYEYKKLYSYLLDDWFFPGVAMCTLYMCMMNEEWAKNFQIPKELYYYVLFDSDNTIGYVLINNKKIVLKFEIFIKIKFGKEDWRKFKKWLLFKFNTYDNSKKTIATISTNNTTKNKIIISK
jgi:hypothetical protein